MTDDICPYKSPKAIRQWEKEKAWERQQQADAEERQRLAERSDFEKLQDIKAGDAETLVDFIGNLLERIEALETQMKNLVGDGR